MSRTAGLLPASAALAAVVAAACVALGIEPAPRVEAEATARVEITATPAPTARGPYLRVLDAPDGAERAATLEVLIETDLRLAQVRLSLDGVALLPPVGRAGTTLRVLLDDVAEGQHLLEIASPLGTERFVFVVDRTPPGLEAAIARDGEVVAIAGSAESGASLTLDGRPVALGADGSFRAEVSGERRAAHRLIATDAAGNTSERGLVTPVPDVRGLYLSAWTASSPELRGALFDRAAALRMNGVVIDVKDSTGRVFMDVGNGTAERIGALSPMLDPVELFADIEARGLYAIARIVCFEDPFYARAHPEAAFLVDGSLWLNGAGLAWSDPRSPTARAYVAELAGAVARAGFHEIQLDYVRFPTGPTARLDRGTQDERVGAIAALVDEVSRAMEGSGAWLSVDVFGLTTTAADDMTIGQWLPDLATRADVISPMVYPSHYALGSYGLPDPDAAPYATVSEAMADAQVKVAGTGAVLRPWLQAFSMGHLYGPAQVQAQVDAAREQGVTGYLLWNPANRY